MGSARKYFLFLVITLLSFLGQPAIGLADAPPPEAAGKIDPEVINFFKDIEVHGFVSSSYGSGLITKKCAGFEVPEPPQVKFVPVAARLIVQAL